jgi:anti-anti-sigma factor
MVGDDRWQTTMTQDAKRTAADRARTEILSMPAELDLVTSHSVVEQGYAAIARSNVRLLLLDLTGLSFCDARGLGAFVRIANHADAAGCRFGLIAPRPPVEKILRIGGLYGRMRVFATTDDALALLTDAGSEREAVGLRPRGDPLPLGEFVPAALRAEPAAVT